MPVQKKDLIRIRLFVYILVYWMWFVDWNNVYADRSKQRQNSVRSNPTIPRVFAVWHSYVFWCTNRCANQPVNRLLWAGFHLLCRLWTGSFQVSMTCMNIPTLCQQHVPFILKLLQHLDFNNFLLWNAVFIAITHGPCVCPSVVRSNFLKRKQLY